MTKSIPKKFQTPKKTTPVPRAKLSAHNSTIKQRAPGKNVLVEGVNVSIPHPQPSRGASKKKKSPWTKAKPHVKKKVRSKPAQNLMKITANSKPRRKNPKQKKQNNKKVENFVLTFKKPASENPTIAPKDFAFLIPLSEESSHRTNDDYYNNNLSKDMISSTSTMKIASSPMNKDIFKPEKFKFVANVDNIISEVDSGNRKRKGSLDQIEVEVEERQRKSNEKERSLDKEIYGQEEVISENFTTALLGLEPSKNFIEPIEKIDDTVLNVNNKVIEEMQLTGKTFFLNFFQEIEEMVENNSDTIENVDKIVNVSQVSALSLPSINQPTPGQIQQSSNRRTLDTEMLTVPDQRLESPGSNNSNRTQKRNFNSSDRKESCFEDKKTEGDNQELLDLLTSGEPKEIKE